MESNWDRMDVRKGFSTHFSKTVTDADLVMYTGITGDTNPLHLDEEHAKSRKFGHRFAPAGLVIGMMHSSINASTTILRDCVVTAGNYRFFAPLKVGDTGNIVATVTSVDREEKRVTLHLECTNQMGGKVADGDIVLLQAPPAEGEKNC